ncbi:MAG TPA: MFS transporter [Xanthobacteraceae bacterium]|jgi:MFS family permease
MTIGATIGPGRPTEKAAARRDERRVLGVACGAHVLHDGYTDLVWVALPIWQAEFGLSYAAVGLLRMIYSGTLAALQIPASRVAARIGAGVVLAIGTALSGLCYCLAGIGAAFTVLVVALFLGGLGAATQHPIASALVARTFAGAHALKAFGTYNFAGDVGKVLLPATATTLLLIMPWRPAYGLLGLVGMAAAVAIIMLMPRSAPESTPAPTVRAEADGAAEAASTRMRFGFRILVLFGIADSVVRGAFFVCLPFLLIGKGAAVTTAGFALTLVFIGGAAGKLGYGWIAQWIGTVATIAISQALAAASIAAVLMLPLEWTLVALPFLGIVLNGVTTVIYGSVPTYSAPERRAHSLSVFYTITIGSAAVAPPVAGFVGDFIGIPNTILIVSALTVATIPLAFLLEDMRSNESVV